jgi:hypothetical protein
MELAAGFLVTMCCFWRQWEHASSESPMAASDDGDRGSIRPMPDFFVPPLEDQKYFCSCLTILALKMGACADPSRRAARDDARILATILANQTGSLV